MGPSSREEIVEVFDAFHDSVSRLVDLSFEALTTPEWLALLLGKDAADSRCPATR
jgi:hypothetical protein